MDLQKIIAEADIRVPNPFATDKKVDWLNEINHEFFDVVKIPSATRFTTANDIDGNPIATYALPSNVRSKNVTKVTIGSEFYRSLLYENVNPGQNNFVFDDGTKEITLYPTPSSGKTGIVVYNKIGIKNFVSTTLTETPDAPEEYHWIYVLGLCERMAKSMNDVTLANNYSADYKGNLVLAQQNFARE